MEYTEINIGDIAELRHSITSSDIEKFVGLTGDDNRLHVDASFAASTSFKKPVAHGMISASFISTIIGTKIPGDGALWYEQNLEFLLPVRVGDEITVKAEVIKKIDRLQAIVLRTEVFNQHRQKVINGTAKVKVITRQQKEDEVVGIRRRRPCILIIGATGGIGSATAGLLAKEECHIILHYHSNESKAEKLKNHIDDAGKASVSTIQADLNNPEHLEPLVEQIQNRYGGIDKLVYAATTKVVNLDFLQLQWADLQHQLNIHVKGLFLLIRKLVPSMVELKYGKIVAITTQATDDPFANLTPYITAKSALEGMVKSMAYDLAPKGIRINLVSPGITDTDLNADLPEKAKLLAASKTPLRRLAMPHDVANAIVYLLSDQSDFLTGETIRVNGGQIMR